ncbi:hypothetical protein BGZ83_011418, partial [Gryganskiella cystojenkinii]
MRQNRDLVRTLTTTFNIALLRAEIDNILLFPHVTELTITDVNILYTFHHGKLDNIFACLIRQHRETLESLKVYNICIPDRDRWYLLRTQSNKEVVSSMHLFKRIKRLEIENVDTRGYEKLRAIGDFWNLSSLQELHLNSVTLALYPDGVTGNTVATSIDPHIQQETSQSSEPCRLRHLTIVQLRGDPETLDRLVLMLGHCPDLSSVIWHSIPDKYYLWPHTFSRIASGLADRTIQWPSLRKLDLRCEYLSDDEITSGVLNAFTGGLEDLAIRAGIFGNQALQVLQDKHSGTLKRLDLYGSSATSATIHSILCTCSRLVFIRAHRLLFIPSRTIPDDRPWICKDLQEWHVVIETERISQDIVDPSGENQKNLEEVTRKIFDRLSTLSRISILALGLDRSLGGCRLSNGTKLDRPCRRRRCQSQMSRPDNNTNAINTDDQSRGSSAGELPIELWAAKLNLILIDSSSDEQEPYLDEAVAILVQRHGKSLRSLELENWRPPGHRQQLFQVLSEHSHLLPRLGCLKLSRAIITGEQGLEYFCKMCTTPSLSLKKLHLNSVIFRLPRFATQNIENNGNDNVGAQLSSLSPLCLEHLTIEDTEGDEKSWSRFLQLLCRAPNLYSLVWKSLRWYRYYEHPSSFARLAKDRLRLQWPKLRKLDIHCRVMNDEQIAATLSTFSCSVSSPSSPLSSSSSSPSVLPTLQELMLRWGVFGERSLTALLTTGLVETLTHLDLFGCHATSQALQSILCVCSRLISLRGFEILSADVVQDPRAWVCQDLEEWHIAFSMMTSPDISNNNNNNDDDGYDYNYDYDYDYESGDENNDGTINDDTDPESARMIFGRLSTLTKLKTLDLRWQEPETTYITSACNSINDSQSQDMIDSNKPRPFDAIPSEIITVILSHLMNKVRPRHLYGEFQGRPSLRDLCSCLYVSKIFYAVSKPILWNDFHSLTSRLLVPSENMCQNTDLVRTLTTVFNYVPSHAELDNILLFPHLTGLTLRDPETRGTRTPRSDYRHGQLDKTFASLIRRHRETLESLKVSHFSMPYNCTQFWKEVISSMRLFKRIKRLEIENSGVRGYENLKAILDLFNSSSFQELRFASVYLYSYDTAAGATDNAIKSPSDPLLHQETSLSSEPCRLRHLTIENTSGDQAFFDRLAHRLRYCPDLSSVVWDSFSSWSENLLKFSLFGSGLIDKTIQWPSLRKLDLYCQSLTDDEITAGILNALNGGLEDLAIQTGIFGSQALQALQDKHSGTLKRLNLFGSSATSATIHSILCTCPRLVYIRAHRLFFMLSTMVPDDQPWVCKDLQEWHVVIELESTYDVVCLDFDDSSYLEEQMDQEKQVSRKIFGRLAALNRISILDLGLDRAPSHRLHPSKLSRARKLDSPPPLQLRLDWGLDQLETLRDLVLLIFDKADQSLGEDEQRWFESKFPKLRIRKMQSPDNIIKDPKDRCGINSSNNSNTKNIPTNNSNSKHCTPMALSQDHHGFPEPNANTSNHDNIKNNSSSNVYRPFEWLPTEIVTMILIYLKALTMDEFSYFRHLYSCLHVSRSFYAVCKPVIWKDLWLNNWSRSQIPTESIRPNRSLVRSLYLSFDVGGHLSVEFDPTILPFPSLGELIVHGERRLVRASIVDMDNLTGDLVQRHQDVLEDLRLRDLYFPSECTQLWKATGSLTRTIKRLEVDNLRIEGSRNILDFSNICTLSPLLEELNLDGVFLKVSDTLGTPVITTTTNDQQQQDQQHQQHEYSRQLPCKLRHLTIHNVTGPLKFLDQLVRMLDNQSPALSSVDWNSASPWHYLPRVTFSSLARGLANGTLHWPSLRKLHLLCKTMDDTLLAGTLNALNPVLEDLAIRAGAFGPQALEALLDKHAGTLTQLDLFGSHVTSTGIYSILCSCPRLVYFRGERLLSSDILSDERPWVCQDLEEWHMAIEMDSNWDNSDDDGQDLSIEEASRKVYQRLSSLRRIRNLDLQRGSYDPSGRYRPPKQGSDFSPLLLCLDHGLDQLATLSDLEDLCFDKAGQNLGKDIWEWA